MPTVFENLNLRETREILVINAPASFEGEVAALEGVTVRRDPRAVTGVHFALVFATTQAEVDKISRSLARKAQGDALLWFAYPKGTSKTYTCEFNRDSGWDVIRSLGFDTVRQVAIDQDWSALRFRRSEYIRPSTGGSLGPSAQSSQVSRRAAMGASGKSAKEVGGAKRVSTTGAARIPGLHRLQANKTANLSAANSIDEYIAQFPPETQKVLEELRALIKASASRATERISYAMPTFDLNGHHLVHFAGYKTHVGFYPVPSGIEAFKEELKPYKSGKGSAQFPLDQPLPKHLIRRIVAFRVAESTAKASR
jgi:uncharacterized protein YdhG (YjbR/CyaY superfamily)